MGQFTDALQIYKKRGLQHLSFRALDFINWKFKTHISIIFNTFWDLKGGKQTFTLNEVSAEFGAGSDEAGGSIRSQINMEYELIEDLLENIESDDVFMMLEPMLD